MVVQKTVIVVMQMDTGTCRRNISPRGNGQRSELYNPSGSQEEEEEEIEEAYSTNKTAKKPASVIMNDYNHDYIQDVDKIKHITSSSASSSWTSFKIIIFCIVCIVVSGLTFYCIRDRYKKAKKSGKLNKYFNQKSVANTCSYQIPQTTNIPTTTISPITVSYYFNNIIFILFLFF